MFQQTCVLGRLGGDPELKTFENGRSLCRFTVAVTEKWKDQNGVPKESTEWFKCNLWGRGADTFAQYTSKGSTVFLIGKMKTRSFEANDGQKKWVTELNVDSFKFVGSANNQKQDDIPAFDSNEEIPF